MSLNRALGPVIRAETTARGLTIMGVTKRAGIHRSAMYRYLNNERAIPLPVVEQIATALGMGTVELLRKAQEQDGDH